MLTIDINCDMGESFGAYTMGNDARIMPYISSANVACGFHAGDPRVMRKTVQLAKEHQVRVGAHPSFPDLVGFGRRNMLLSYEEIRSDVLYQIGALSAFAAEAKWPLQHVKPHGQLNNMAMTNPVYAEAIVDAIAAFNPELIVISYGGLLMEAAQAKGLTVAYEVYADRAYQADGQLVPRSMPGAVIHDVHQVLERVMHMITHQEIVAISGEHLPRKIDTVCVHGDTPGADEIAMRLSSFLRSQNVHIAPLSSLDR
ncbi:LamB/YcsF family protein [Sulfobacillus thermosulfidooxidans]|uniref:LamB/YcsF family protein n=1 Tax=Sulfobacillus thermosulfidooxidans TaxID=28034 RepID=UPI0006B67214|nr:5-oxoprolinase subunit PxpA [Sulfobacillus thermosulfidooxidans]